MADLALLTVPGDVVTLSGDLGAGKTAAARAMIRYLADDDALEVPSPTFTLAQSYDLPSFPLLHADLYRIGDASELEEIGLSPLPEGMVALIEWPERAGSDTAARPHRHRLQPSPDARLERACGRDHRLRQRHRLVERLKLLRQFLHTSGFIDAGAQAHGGRRLDALLCAAARRTTDIVHPDELAEAAGWPAIYDGKPYAPPCISPKTSSRSSPSTGACATAASRRPKSITAISRPAS